MLAPVDVHEIRLRHHAAGKRKLVLDRAGEAEHLVEAHRGRNVVLAQDSVADAFLGGHELAEHRPPRVERTPVVDQRTIEDLGRVAARIDRLGQAQNTPLGAFLLRRHANVEVVEPQLLDQLVELGRTRNRQPI
jgi:hypothetical protein